MLCLPGPGSNRAWQVRSAPYRYIHDSELRDIFFLTPQSGQAFFLPQHTAPFPGSTYPVVTPLLRGMLYLLTMSMGQRVQLERKIAATLKGREQIVIRAKLLSLIGHILDKPWAFPALMDTPSCKAAFHELTKIASESGTVATTGPDTLSGLGVSAFIKKRLSLGVQGMAGFGVGLLHELPVKLRIITLFTASASRMSWRKGYSTKFTEVSGAESTRDSRLYRVRERAVDFLTMILVAIPIEVVWYCLPQPGGEARIVRDLAPMFIVSMIINYEKSWLNRFTRLYAACFAVQLIFQGLIWLQIAPVAK